MPSLIIVGAGPAGLAPLFAAARHGKLSQLLRSGIVVIDQGVAVAAGQLSEYCISSDSPAEAFLDIVERSDDPELRELLDHESAKALASLRGFAVPLTLAAEFLTVAAQRICAILRRSPGCEVVSNHKVISVQRDVQQWRVTAMNQETGETLAFRSASVHLATGAHQPRARLSVEAVGLAPLLPRFAGKVMQSGELFRPGGMEQVMNRLRNISSPRVVIVGGSTSAGAAAVHLLNKTDIPFGRGGVTVLHRSPLRLFYASAGEAQADGYTDFRPEDVCRLSGRVYRLSGFRFESKELLRNALLPHRQDRDPRLSLQSFQEGCSAAEQTLQQADIIIAAMGYRPRMVTVLDDEGREIALHTPVRGDWAMVDQQCRVLTADGNPLEGLTALGLAIGPCASTELGGEIGYRGQINSLWLWQNTLGQRVVEQVLSRAAASIIPLMRPSPPQLSHHGSELRAIEESSIYTNFGPVNTRLENGLIDVVFSGSGNCLTVCNATLGLMLAIRDAVGDVRPGKTYALMPSFTFAAGAQAALWCGLTPLFCDIDRDTWLPCADSEDALLREFAGRIAVVVPNCTFGNSLDLRRYESISDHLGIPVVVDAAASLGSRDAHGLAFGHGSPLPIIFSMHATKPFSTGEGGLLYSADKLLIERLRAMSCFGFGEDRVATMPGLNAKLSEVAALTALLQLREFPAHIAEREQIDQWYRNALGGDLKQQVTAGTRQVLAFESVLLPPKFAAHRAQIQQSMREHGVVTGNYFSPHLAEQVYMRSRSVCPPLPVTEDVAPRILSLPMFVGMRRESVIHVLESLETVLEEAASSNSLDNSVTSSLTLTVS